MNDQCLRKNRCLCLLLFALAAPATASAMGASAQTSGNGAIRGSVLDEQRAVLPGATIVATSPDVGGTFTAISDDAGYYRLLDLPPGTYEITVDVSGFAKLVRPGIVMRAGLNLALDFNMKVGALSERITVNVDSPLLESTSATQAMNVSGDLQRSLPLTRGRGWSDFVLLTPGTINTLSSTASASGFWVHGSDFGSHVITIDGADVASPGQSSNSYLMMSAEVLEDVQIKTNGIDASAPLGQGAVINIVSKSGTNVLQGGGVIVWQPRKWSANNNPGGTTSAYELLQPDLTLGGPILRNRAWFFGSYRYVRQVTGVSRTPDQLNVLRALVPGFEPLDSKTTSKQSFGKATMRLNAAHQIQGFYSDGAGRSRSVAATYALASSDSLIGGRTGSAALSSIWGSHLTTRVGVTYNDQANWDEPFILDRPQRIVYNGMFLSSGKAMGSGALAVVDNTTTGGQSANPEKLTMTADATYHRRGWLGSHDLQAGVYLQPGRVAEFTLHYVNNGYVSEDVVLRNPANPGAGYVPFHRRVYDVDHYQFRNNVTDDYAFYVQDSWQPHDRVTVAAGVRVDRILRVDRIFNETVQDLWEVGPRLGINVRLTAEGHDIARASWGRIHDALSSNTNYTAGNISAGYVDTYDTDLNGTFETTFVTPGTTALNLARRVDPKTYRQGHNDDFSVGYVHQFPSALTVDASLVRREFRNRPSQVDINGIIDEHGVFRGYRDEKFRELVLLTSNTWNWPVYTALQFQVARQTARLSLIANYTRQFRHLEGTWQPNDPASYIQPDAFANDKGVGDVLRYQSFTSLTGTDMTEGRQWRDHAARLGVAWQAPWRLQLAASYTLQSGVWSGPVVTRLTAPDPRFGPPTVTLSTGEVVSNPLATLFRFAGSDRGDGQLKTPTLHQLNLRVGRTLALGGVRIDPAIDILNITNHDADQSFGSTANQTFSATFGVTSGRQPPRAVQISARVAF
jgi:Carboxypeptidase regulatory-like domain